MCDPQPFIMHILDQRATRTIRVQVFARGMVAKKRFFPDIASLLANTRRQKLFVDVDLPSAENAAAPTPNQRGVLLAQFTEEVTTQAPMSTDEVVALYHKYRHHPKYAEEAVKEWNSSREGKTESPQKRAKILISELMPINDDVSIELVTPVEPATTTPIPHEVIDDDSDDDLTFEGLILAPQEQPPTVEENKVQLDDMFARAQQYSQWFQAQEKSRLWRRYIGVMEVEVTATRPTVKPLPYQTPMVLKRLNPKTDKRIKNQDLAVVRVYTEEHDREVGRISEDLTRIFAPLMDFEMIEFKLHVLFETAKRLLTGDLFFIKMDIYLTHKAFQGVAGADDDDDVVVVSQTTTQKKPMFGFGQETSQEVKLRRRQTALSRLFSKLNVRPLRTLSGEEEPEEDAAIDVDSAESLTPLDGDLSLDHLKKMYSDNNESKLLSLLPETTTPPSENFKLLLRAYQCHGLAWMLTREKEYDLVESLLNQQSEMKQQAIRDSDKTIDPLWHRYKWPEDPTGLSDGNTGEFFFGNMHSGEMSIEEPVVKSTTLGGILADEMGLGKTISALSLVMSCPADASPDIKTTRPYAANTTLIVVPMSLLSQWKNEFDKANNNPNFCCKVYYGDDTELDLSRSLIKNVKASNRPVPVVMLTTYGTIVNEYVRLHRRRDAQGNLPKEGIYSVEFFRIILDEGHNIRNRSTKTAKLIYEVAAQRKWVLTGTPIINRLDDLYSLVKFLRLNPWQDFSRWKSFITVPFENKEITQTLQVIKLILEPIFLRRTKLMKQKDGKPLVELPPKVVEVETVNFSDQEKLYYDWFRAKATQKFREGVKSGHLLKQYSQILTHILRLRQICCHVDLVKEAAISDLEEQNATNAALEKDEEFIKFQTSLESKQKQGFELASEANKIMYSLYGKFDPEFSECSICTTSPIPQNELVVTACGHTFCLSCILEHLDFESTPDQCPNCRAPVNKYRLFKLRANSNTDAKEVRFMTQGSKFDDSQGLSKYPYRLFLYDPERSSSKIIALCKHLRAIKEQLPGEKVIVFSQFSSYLDIIEAELKIQGDFNVFKYDGRLQMAEREKLLKKFDERSNNRLTVLLLSLKAGGVGLNLTTANKAFMMDPWWLPSIENQAIDRIHRIGQNTSVKVVRFVMENSIEQKMLKIQELKNHLGEAVGAEEEQKKRRIEEIQIMFED